MKSNQLIPAITLFVIGLFGPLAQAQTTVLDNTGLSSDSSITLASGQSIHSGFRLVQLASGFTTGSSDSVLDSITLDLTTGNSGSDFALSLYSNNGSSQPQDLLETLTGDASPDAGGLVTYASSGTVLTANTTYWWVASIVAPSGNGHFYSNCTEGGTGTSPEGWTFDSTYLNSAGSGWDDIGFTAQFSVDATIGAVPEPSTLALAGMGGLGLAIMFRRTARNAKNRRHKGLFPRKKI